jgi:uncharacterized protein (TIGR03000 family)
MFPRTFACGGLWLAIATLVLLTLTTSQAAARGRFHGGFGFYGMDFASYRGSYPRESIYLSPSGGSPTSQPSGASTLPAPADTSAHLTVTVPAHAEVWFGGAAMHATGSVRRFVSPPLLPAQRYVYHIRARWVENGHEVTQARQVEVTAGAHIDLYFPLPPETGR